MELDVVRIANESDFANFVKLCDEDTAWDLVYQRGAVNVWTRTSPDVKKFKMLRISDDFLDVPPHIVYDVLHDPAYRAEWDRHMLEGRDIGHLDGNNDVCYYAMKSPAPFHNRDFLIQRSWMETPTQKIIFNHSVCHESCPPNKNYVRAISFVTGFIVRPVGSGGSRVIYLSHTDPKGSLPSWVVNSVSKMVAPKVMETLHEACLKYPAWKEQHDPEVKPWLHPEQLTSPLLEFDDCRAQEYQQEAVDESRLKEVDFSEA